MAAGAGDGLTCRKGFRDRWGGYGPEWRKTRVGRRVLEVFMPGCGSGAVFDSVFRSVRSLNEECLWRQFCGPIRRSTGMPCSVPNWCRWASCRTIGSGLLIPPGNGVAVNGSCSIWPMSRTPLSSFGDRTSVVAEKFRRLII